MINECSKLALKEYKTKHNRVGKVIHRELCKKFKFDNMNKLYMHNPTFVLENEMHKLLWDFVIKTDHLILPRRPDIIIITKKDKKQKRNVQNCGLCCPGWPQSKSERKWKEG